MVKKILKKTLKVLGIILVLLIAAIIIVPIVFKDELKEMVIKEVNKNLTAELSLEDFDLTFFSTFPNMTVELYNAKLTGLNEFEGVTLASIGKAEAHIGFWNVISGDQIEIDEIHIYDPTFDVRVLEDGTANYDIVKPDSLKTDEELEEPSSFKLSLKDYSINNALLKYDDRSLNMYAELDSLIHTGKGDLTADVIDFETSTEMNNLSYRMDGISYLTQVKTEAIVNILMEFTDKSSKFTLKENEIKLNEIAFSVDGMYEIFEDHDEMDLKLDASDATFKQFLSLIPAFYHSGYESMATSGSLSLNGVVKGEMNEEDLPSWDFGMNIKNASINYPDLPGKITNIQVGASSKYPGGSDMNKMTVDVPKFHANMGKNKIDANLFMNNLLVDPYLKSKIVAYFDLATMKDYVPPTEGESYNGILDANIDINGKMSDLEAGDFEKFKAAGDLIVSDMKYSSTSLDDDVSIDKMHFVFSPERLALNDMDAKMGKTDFHVKGELSNYFGYLLRDNEVLKGDFTFHSNHMDLDEFIPADEAGSPEESTAESTASSDSDEPILVPKNIDFKLASSMNNVKYNGIDIKNLKGNIRMKDETIYLEDLTMNTMGGTVGLKGAYNTQDHKNPKVDFGYNIANVNIQDLASNFVTVGKIAPLAKLAEGKITSNFDMQTKITPSFEPILSSLSSIGDIRSDRLAIKNIKVFNKIENVTKLNNFSSQKLENFKTKFTVNDGKVAVLPFDIKLGNINTTVSGYTTLDQKMNYDFDLQVPKEEIPASMIKEVEAAMGKLNALVPKLDVGKLPAFIPVKVKAVGDVSDPQITTDFKEAILKATGDFKEDLINSVTETVKDTIKQTIQEVKDNVNEEIEKQKAKILADAQKEADKVKAEAKNLADQTRAEANKQADEVIKAAGSNPIKKKLAEESAKKIRAEGESKAQKIEAEGDKKANDIMKKAQERADKLG